MATLYIAINISLYGFLFFFNWRKYKHFTPGTFIVFCWMVVALFGMFYYHSNKYYSHYTHPVTLLPFLAEFLLFYIAVKPIIKNDNLIKINANNDSPIIKPLALLIGILSLPALFDILVQLFNTSIAASVAEYQMREVEDNALDKWTYKFAKRCYILVSWLRFISPILIFYFYKKNTKKIYLIAVILGTIVNPLYGLLIGNRGPVVTVSLYMLLVFLYFRNQLSPNKVKFVKKIFIIVGGLILVYISLMTVARFIFIQRNSHESVFAWVIRYMGEPFLNMNQDAFWNNKYLWGELTFPDWYQYFTGRESANRWDLMRQIGIRCHVFYTSIGQLFIEFPYVVVFVLTIVYALIMRGLASQISKSLGMFIIWMTLCTIMIDGIFIMPIQNSSFTFLLSIVIGLIIKNTERKITF